MAGLIRLVVASVQPELIESIKQGLQNKPEMELIISVSRPSEAENKFARLSCNVLLVDTDSTPPDELHIRTMEARYQLLVLRTALTHARSAGQAGTPRFILKPAAFTNMTASHFVTNIYQQITGFRKQQTPPGYRDVGRLVDGTAAGGKVIAIASSTGGTNALEKVIEHLPADSPPIVAVQHMPSGFTKLFAERLNSTFKMTVKEAETGDFLLKGQFLLAPADRHMRIVRQQGKLAVDCYVGMKIHGVMPAADILFESVAEMVRANAIGVILTGMGADGARGLMLMHNNGAKTIGQDKETCVVYGMPKVARDLGALDFEVPLDKIADKIMQLA